MNEIKNETGKEITTLKKELSKIKDLINNSIQNEINKYKNIIEQQKLTINDLNNRLNNVIEINKNNSKSIELFKNTIKNKEEELNSLNIKLQDINNKISSQNENLLSKYKNMSVRFVSINGNINYLIQCNADDKFYKVIGKLYL